MDARELLRHYLEQRREAGESELVLDRMPVEDVLRMLGASRGTPASSPPAEPVSSAALPSTVAERDVARPSDAASWRETLRAAGGAPGSIVQPSSIDRTEPAPTAIRGPDAPPPIVAEQPPGAMIAGLASLDEIARAVAGCTRCPLHASAKNPVPGEGSLHADLVCVGEAPGATEDETGRPFVGAAGQLLTKILAAISLRREDVFICNVLKHRPPGNRNPAPDEVAACSPFLVRQLELIRPKVILALGSFAAQTLLDTKLSIGKLRGSVHEYHGIPLVVTYHPAALLRNAAWKRPTWEDVQLARRILDRPSDP